MAWNLNAAITHLVKSASNSSLHQCAKYVRQAIEAGGVSTAGRPVSACKYKSFLPTIGFNFVGKIEGKINQSNWSRKNARPGDIAVMDHGEHGHICMWSGQQWISDFKQNNMWPYGGDGTCYIYRYNGQIDGSLQSMLGFGSTGLRYTVPLNAQDDHKIINNLSNIQRNLLTEILEYLGDFSITQQEDIYYENNISKDDSSLSESIVETGMFWSNDYFMFGGIGGFTGGASINAIPLQGVRKVAQQTGVPVGFFILVGASESGFRDQPTNSIGYGGYFGQSTKNGVGFGASLEKQALEVAKTFKRVQSASPGAGYQELLVLGYIYHHLPAVGSRYWKQTNGKIFSLDPDYIYNNIKACYSGGSSTRYAEAITINVVAQYLSNQIISSNIY